MSHFGLKIDDECAWKMTDTFTTCNILNSFHVLIRKSHVDVLCDPSTNHALQYVSNVISLTPASD